MDFNQLIGCRSESLQSTKELRYTTKLITEYMLNSYVEGKFKKLKEILEWTEDFREEIEDNVRIERNSNFYYSYLLAVENTYSSIVETEIEEKHTFQVINNKKHLRNIIEVIIDEEYITHSDLAERVKLSKSQLSNIFSSSDVKEIGFISTERLGRNKGYSLTQKGIKFCKRDFSKERKKYSNKELVDIIRALGNNNYDEVNKIIEKHSLNIGNEILNYKKERLVQESRSKQIYNNSINTTVLKIKNKREYKKIDIGIIINEKEINYEEIIL